MSRIGKRPLTIPSGVKVAVAGNEVHVEGAKGKLAQRVGQGVKVTVEGNVLSVERVSTSPQALANWGTTRAILGNMVTGVTKGWTRVLEINGVGYQANVAGSTLKLNCGFSHEVVLDIPGDVKAAVNKNVLTLESPNRQSVGQFAARIRSVQPPEPYLGKGIKYAEEVIRRKAGKTAKK